jgi:hypothetical protein
MTGRIQIEIDSAGSGFAEGSAKWFGEQEDLRSELRRVLGPDAVPGGPPDSGAKGVELVVPIVVALASGRAIPALAQCIQTWLIIRPRDWVLNIKKVDNGKESWTQVSGTSLPSDIVKSLSRLLGEEVA